MILEPGVSQKGDCLSMGNNEGRSVRKASADQTSEVLEVVTADNFQ
jgi:hypothetical protein